MEIDKAIFFFDFFSKVCSSQEYQRKLHPDDLPLRVQQQRTQNVEQFHYIVRKNPHFRRQLLPPIVENKSIMPPKIENTTPNKCRCKSYARLFRIPTTDNLNGFHTLTTTTTYVPVYNNREIHAVCNSFSSFDIDKKLWNIDSSPNSTSLNIGHSVNTVTNSAMKIVREAVKNNPAKGYGNFVYV